MTADRPSIVPWVTAGAAGVALAALLFVYFAVLQPDKSDAMQPTNAPGGLSSTEKAAVTGASQDAANFLTFTRANFTSDFNRALASSTGALRTDVQGKRAALLKTMTAGKFDLGADVTHSALQGPSDRNKGYVVLVSLQAYRSTTRSQTVPQNLAVEVVKVKGKWLADSVENIGIQ